jgi:hypothetical protein
MVRRRRLHVAVIAIKKKKLLHRSTSLHPVESTPSRSLLSSFLSVEYFLHGTAVLEHHDVAQRSPHGMFHLTIQTNQSGYSTRPLPSRKDFIERGLPRNRQMYTYRSTSHRLFKISRHIQPSMNASAQDQGPTCENMHKSIGSSPLCYFCFIGFRAELGRTNPVADHFRERPTRRFVACALPQKLLPHCWLGSLGPLSHCSLVPFRFRTTWGERALFTILPGNVSSPPTFQRGC